MESQSFISFNWKKPDCQGPPEVMLSLGNREDSEIISLVEQDYPMETCRYKKAIISGEECCRTSLDPTLKFQSISGSAASKFPIVANGNEYCFMSSIAGNATSTFQSAYFLSGGGCLEDKIKCNNGKLEIYPASGCIGRPETFALAATMAAFTSSSAIQAFQAQKLTVTSGVSQYKWVTYFPQSLYAPHNNNGIEIFGTLLQVLTLAMTYGALMYYLYHSLRGSGKSIYKVFAASHFLWLIYAALDIYTQYLLTDDFKHLITVASFDYVFRHLSMLVTVLITAHSLLTLVYVTTLRTKILVFAAITVLHFALTGGDYLTYFQPDYPSLGEWSLASAVYFTVFMFVFDCIVTLLVTSKIVRAYAGRPLNLKESVVTALQEINISSYVMAQFFLMAFYYVSYCAVRYTLVMGSDRGDSTIQYGFQNFILSLHAVIASVSYDNFSKLLQKMKEQSYEKKKKILMEETTFHDNGYSPSSKGFGINLFPKSIMTQSGAHHSPLLGASFSSGAVTKGNTTAKSASSGRITDFGSPNSSKKSSPNSSENHSPLESYDLIESFAQPQRNRNSDRFNVARFSIYSSRIRDSGNHGRFSVSSPQIRDSGDMQLNRFSQPFTSGFEPSSPY